VLIMKALAQEGKTFTIARKTLPSLKLSVMRDFMEILNNLEIYEQANHNKSDHTYQLNNNLFEFISMDQPQKKRGAKRDILWLNEANEFNWEDWIQLNMRTTAQVYIDYNPSDEYHWIYDEIIPREDCTFIKSTYKDNTFLEPEVVKEIERLKEIDDNYWRVYGLGEVGHSQAQVFTNFTPGEIPNGAKLEGYGLDFGYAADPTALIGAWGVGDDLYLDEILYQTGMTNDEIGKFIKEQGIGREKIIADSAEPKSIEEIYRMGINIHGAWKGPGSIAAGIDKLVRRKVFITSRSLNLLKEFKNYKYKQDKNGKILKDPVDMWNHGIDASRYIFSHNKKTGTYAVH
jgi:phage terminase large subunit